MRKNKEMMRHEGYQNICSDSFAPSTKHNRSRRIIFVLLIASNKVLSLQPLTRRQMFQIAGSTASVAITGDIWRPKKPSWGAENDELQVFRVIPDAGQDLSPQLQALSTTRFWNELGSIPEGALWLGEHHNAAKDHALQARILEQLHQNRQGPMAVGLEQVQIKFQPFLDQYIGGTVTLDDLRTFVEWDKRWMWPFDIYKPIFSTAKELGVPLIALNVNSEDLTLVEKNGLPGLPQDTLSLYIEDRVGFADFAKQREFSAYVDYVILPSYQVHQALGLLQYTMSGEKLKEQMPFRNFLSGRILWDECMASRAASWTKKHPGGLLLGLVGADHVKFQDGIPARYARMSGDKTCVSIMLNPSLIDTRPSGSVQNVEDSDSPLFPDKLTLQLRYLKDGISVDSPVRSLASSTGGVLPLSDYILVG